ncbi:hypothetical protein D3C79_878660 [compost metagenome]
MLAGYVQHPGCVRTDDGNALAECVKNDAGLFLFQCRHQQPVMLGNDAEKVFAVINCVQEPHLDAAMFFSCKA